MEQVKSLNIIKYSVFFLSFVLMILPGITNKELADFHMYLLGILFLTEIRQVKAISLYSVWIAGFIYIILSEMILSPEGDDFNWTVRYLLSANNVVLIGYSIAANKQLYKYKKTNFSTRSQFFPFLLALLTIFYLYNMFPKVSMSYFYGRQLVSTMGSGTLKGSLNSALGLILPALIAYYVVHIKKSSKWVALAFVLPIFLFLIILSTRFKLLFSVIPFFLVSGFLNFDKVNLKSMVLLLFAVVVLSLISQLTKINRNESYQNRWENLSERKMVNGNLAEIIANQCSPEGCVAMTRLAERYFEDHEHTYGKSIGFITYFWVPRAIWPDKPTQVDHWLPRYFNPNMADTASTASGFTGELRADFGYLSYFFLFLLGVLLKRCNYYLMFYNYGRSPCYESIYASLLIPTTFFSLRGLNLSITTYICAVLLLLLISKFIGVR
ncbi:MAG: hypothetical protein IJ760_04110 [Bacteroidales bacterium]|nr:hypothetical protein [Bacteroidales bacterium]